MEGPLCKWTNVMKGYQYRYFVLDPNQALLSYYTSKEKMIKGERRGCVRLKGAAVGIGNENERFFTITVDGKMFHFQAHDAEEMSKWVAALEDTIFRHTYRKKMKKNDTSQMPTMLDFEKKLTETDAYLQILIGQLDNLNKEINSVSDNCKRERLIDIKAKTLTLLDGVKHTIILLQISKNTLNQVNGEKSLQTVNNKSQSSEKKTIDQFDDHKNRDSYSSSSVQSISSIANRTVIATASTSWPASNLSYCSIKSTTPNSSKSFSSESSPKSTLKETPSSIISSKSNSINRDLSVDSVREAIEQTSINEIPEMSYSSDEDEFFYDASEDTPSATIINLDQLENNSQIIVNKEEKIINLASNPSKIDYDSLYDDYDEDDDLGSLEGHGSVISHLISQVKIGMDLTKVVLPTFILERRSLLEMYADFFAHPDLFVSIADYNTPEERFIQTVRWYLSAFHAGRKSSVAKKPYNPVLGEMFKCYWNLPENCHVTNDNRKMSLDSPIPWASKDSLQFVAEQVSHHPPISAFYAEYKDKRITFTAHIYTKSKFLGLSIGVHNIGEGTVVLMDRGEEYTCTFPSAYGRSILTVPWVELGGSVLINCQQTGFSANIEFLTKPLFGGKKNKISGEILNPAKKVIMNIEGDWNGVMYCKRNNGPKEIFVDTKAMAIVKKQLKPIAEQEPYESRRLWKEVTAALKLQDVQAATSAKFAIEEGQRELVKKRQETNKKWENRVFQQTGDHWVYKSPSTKAFQKT